MRRLRLGSQGSERGSMTDLQDQIAAIKIKIAVAARQGVGAGVGTLANWYKELAELQEQRADAAGSQVDLRHRAYLEGRERIASLEAALSISADDVGRIMHESWSRTKRAQGFHGRHETCVLTGLGPKEGCCVVEPYGTVLRGYSSHEYPFGAGTLHRCYKFHPDLIPWKELPQGQQDLNLHAFDAVFAEMRRRAGLNKEERA